MKSLWNLTKKNLKMLIRAKGSALIVIFAPLLLILIVGLSFNNSSKYGINIGVYAPIFNDEINAFINTLQEEEFEITKYDSSLDKCIEDIKSGIVHTCITVPESFKMEDNSQKEITFYVDPSKLNLVWMIQETIQNKLNLKSQEISQAIALDMLTRMGNAKSKVGTEKEALTGVKEGNRAGASTADVSRSRLLALDLNPPATVYNFSIVSAFQGNITSSISSSLARIGRAKSVVENSSLDGEAKSSLQSALNSISSRLKGINNLINGTTDTSYTAVIALINNMQTDLNSTSAKLTAASSQVGTTTQNLVELKSTLNQGVASLEGIQSVLGEVQANLEAQKVTDAKTTSTPLSIKIEKVAAPNTYLNYLFPALIILVCMFSSLLLGTTLVMLERTSPAYVRNFFLPIRKVTFVLATYLPNLLLILIQVIVILGLALVFLKSGYESYLLVALILFLACSVFTFLGMALGYIFNSDETAILASISLGTLLLFLSGVILPLESVSPALRNVMHFNPFVLSEKLVREVFIFSAPIQNIWVDLLLLFGYVLILFLLILVLETLMHKHLVEHFLRKHHQHHKDKERSEAKPQ